MRVITVIDHRSAYIVDTLDCLEYLDGSVSFVHLYDDGSVGLSARIYEDEFHITLPA